MVNHVILNAISSSPVPVLSLVEVFGSRRFFREDVGGGGKEGWKESIADARDSCPVITFETCFELEELAYKYPSLPLIGVLTGIDFTDIDVTFVFRTCPMLIKLTTKFSPSVLILLYAKLCLTTTTVALRRSSSPMATPMILLCVNTKELDVVLSFRHKHCRRFLAKSLKE
ncbi:hypothetical protein LXL04_019517 [Taraxacum kok-saghyz]